MTIQADLAVTLAAMDLHETRMRQRLAKAALRTYREQHGSCREASSEREEGRRIGSHPDCFREDRLPRDQWCAVCRGSQPLWEEYRAAANAAGRALRRLMWECRGLDRAEARLRVRSGGLRSGEMEG